MKLFKGDFSTQEIICSLFCYTTIAFKNLNLKKALTEWGKELDHNASAYAFYQGSPFDEDALNLKIEIDKKPEAGIIYVVPHYFYQVAEYQLRERIDNSWIIKLAPIIGSLFTGQPMDLVYKGQRTEYFVCNNSSDRTENYINVYMGSNFIQSFPLKGFNSNHLKDAIRSVK